MVPVPVGAPTGIHKVYYLHCSTLELFRNAIKALAAFEALKHGAALGSVCSSKADFTEVE